ncbi:MAG: hypothetical protein ACOZQL_14045 [Myxococcota bacterium]
MLLALVLLALPDHVPLKTPTESFTAAYELAVREGRLWWRKPGEAWVRVPPDGLPVSSEKSFHAPERVVALTADGDNLVALGPAGEVFYAKLSTLRWVDQWGPTGLQTRLSAQGTDALAMSHRLIPYEDLDGNPHPISAGVTTLFALRDGGRTLAYADPWLPANFERTFCLPARDSFIAASLSASASTVFVMDESGRSFTRLVDFDIHGDNPVLPYSYSRERRAGARSVVRTLPGPEWVEQPRIPGRHTTRLTILQTGATNADRELRVEGEGGVWKKRLDDAEWRFDVDARVQPQGGFVTPGLPPPSSGEHDVVLTAKNPWRGTRVTLEQWNPRCPPARLHVVGPAEDLQLELPFHFGLAFGTDDARRLKGALLLPEGDSPTLARLRRRALGKRFVDVELVVTRREVTLLPLGLRFPR